MKYFNRQTWRQKVKEPDWYLAVPDLIRTLGKLREENKDQYEATKEEIYGFFEAELRRGEVCLGETGPDWDSERTTIDSIAIHHTSMPPGLSTQRLSAIELVRLYAPYYANPTYEDDLAIKGQPIFSSHFRLGEQVFWPYHWMVRIDGKIERLLDDHEVGWHAGDWDFNCRSVAIVFDDDLESRAPTQIQLTAAAKIIREHYPDVRKDQVFGHSEINPATVCPSKLFLTREGTKGWKEKLLELI